MIYGVLCVIGHNMYRLRMCTWNNTQKKVLKHDFYGTKQQTLEEINRRKCLLVNASITRNNAFYFRKYKNALGMIQMIAESVREALVKQYGDGTNLCGHCIEASEILQMLYYYMGLETRTIEGWCEFDDEYYGSDRPYDPHTWLEVPSNNKNGKPLYVDITADQFNPGMYAGNEYPGVILNIGLPHGMSYDEPVEYDD